MDLLFDGTKIERIWDQQTGAVDFNQPSLVRWQVSNGRYQEVLNRKHLNPLVRSFDPLLRSFGAGPGVDTFLDSPVTWEGPDRFWVQGPGPKHRTMTWSRCESVTDLPITHIPIGPK
jgi:hypothetical protein